MMLKPVKSTLFTISTLCQREKGKCFKCVQMQDETSDDLCLVCVKQNLVIVGEYQLYTLLAMTPMEHHNELHFSRHDLAW